MLFLKIFYSNMDEGTPFYRLLILFSKEQPSTLGAVPKL